MNKNKENGMVLLLVLMFCILLFIMMTVVAAQSATQTKSTLNASGTVEATNNARSSLKLAGSYLSAFLMDGFSEVVHRTYQQTNAWYYGPMGESPTQDEIDTGLLGLKQRLQEELDAALCDKQLLPNSGLNGEKLSNVRIYFTDTSCNTPLPESIALPKGSLIRGAKNPGPTARTIQMYALPYVIIAEGLTVGGVRQTYKVSGKISFEVGKGPYSRFQYFSGSQLDGSQVRWFNNWDLFNGPVHTNSKAYIRGKPWFGDVLSTSGCEPSCKKGQVAFSSADTTSINNNSVLTVDQLSPSPQAPCFAQGDCPGISGGVDWGSPMIDMPSNQNGRFSLAAQNAGLYFNTNLQSITLSTEMNAMNNSAQRISICLTTNTASCTDYAMVAGRPELYRWDGTSYDANAGWGYTTHIANFNGLIYTTGGIANLTSMQAGFAPALTNWAKITIAAANDINITNSLRYAEPPCTTDTRRVGSEVQLPECTKLSVSSVLGIYSNNNINFPFTTSSADSITVMGALMAQGSIRATGNGNKGELRILGSMVQGVAGAMNDINPWTGIKSNGFNLRLTFDPRFGDTSRVTPPLWPDIPTSGLLSASNVSDAMEKVRFD